MAIEIKAPLAAQLFALGAAPGQEKFSYKGNKPSGFNPGRLPPAPALQGEDHSGGQARALASVGGALAGAAGKYFGAPSSTPDSQGNGFGLGGTLVSGDAGNAKFAGDEKKGILDMFTTPEQQEMLMDNGTTPQTNPYALNYGNAPKKSSLFNYGGSYGGATY